MSAREIDRTRMEVRGTHARSRLLFTTITFFAALMSPSLADGSSVPYSEGGYVPDFVKIVRQYNASGEQFRIQGTCKSACTLFLGIRNVCVERNAKASLSRGSRHRGKQDRTRHSCEPCGALSI